MIKSGKSCWFPVKSEAAGKKTKGRKPRESFPHPRRQDEPELTPSALSQSGEEAAASQEAPESTEHWAGGGSLSLLRVSNCQELPSAPLHMVNSLA